jgi:hypothetical protein
MMMLEDTSPEVMIKSIKSEVPALGGFSCNGVEEDAVL